MPKRTQAEYGSDGGFVEDVPKGKKSKAASGNKDNRKPQASTEHHVDDEGNVFWEVRTGLRRLGVSSYKGTTMINIREYYEKDGKNLPGKKGISLSLDQYATLLAVLPQLETLLRSKGEDVPRPQYDGAGMIKKTKKEDIGAADEAQDEVDDDTVDAKPVASSKIDKYRMKHNHEATSDEDDED
ncbi:hypothetical protein LTR62_001191 [Meristemomyces frigidus]|uniref:Transcriptional coactivator p15 (PC4) C-terminal domain-containing protein n=1 Tax=Meristemomyces frigidus TaxID=1508187 RepID=A0AAN7TGN8_9PEZI|nr:hypothetical protein LTR62_001191 [Meristemomyces frigidus]